MMLAMNFLTAGHLRVAPRLILYLQIEYCKSENLTQASRMETNKEQEKMRNADGVGIEQPYLRGLYCKLCPTGAFGECLSSANVHPQDEISGVQMSERSGNVG